MIDKNNIKKIGVIGYGNIGNLIVNNVLSLNLIKQEDIIVSNRNLNKLNNLKENYPNLTTTDNNKLLAEKSQIIFIFVETPDFKNVLLEIKPYLNEKSHIIHASAGLSFNMISNIYSGKITKLIPTIISKVDNSNTKKGVTLISHNKKVNKEDKKFIEDLFENFTNIKIFNAKEENGRDFEIATLVSSCSHAFLASLIKNTLIILNHSSSLNPDDLEDILIKTIKAATIQLDDKKITIDKLMNKTATPGGITQIGLDYIDENNAVIDELFKELFKEFDNVKSKLNQEYLK
jgi:pyrroline-5-carboxylate reductase